MKRMVIAASCLAMLAVLAPAQTPSETGPASPSPAQTPSESTPASPTQSAEPKLNRSALCTAIGDRQPVGALEKEPYEFKTDVGQIFFWTEITVQNPPQTVTHRYYADGKAVADVKLNLKAPRTRTWSSKKIWPASWKVEVLSESGKTLGSASFTVSP